MMMRIDGGEILAMVSVVGAVVSYALTSELELPIALVGLAGTVYKRGSGSTDVAMIDEEGRP